MKLKNYLLECQQGPGAAPPPGPGKQGGKEGGLCVPAVAQATNDGCPGRTPADDFTVQRQAPRKEHTAPPLHEKPAPGPPPSPPERGNPRSRPQGDSASTIRTLSIPGAPNAPTQAGSIDACCAKTCLRAVRPGGFPAAQHQAGVGA